MEEPLNSHVLKWYQKGWGVMLGGFGLVVGVIVVIIIGFTVHYLIKIKRGEGALLSRQFSSEGFTRSIKNDKVIDSSKIDRTILEEGGYPYLGSSNPKVVIVEFIDFKCPFCKESVPIIEEVIKKYGNKVKVIFRNFPAESIHPGATRLAEFGYCADKQGRFWSVYSYLYTNQETISEAVSDQELKEIALKNDLNIPVLETCLKAPSTMIAINKDYSDGFKSGVEGTPTFFINGQKIFGVISLEGWKEFLNTL